MKIQISSLLLFVGILFSCTPKAPDISEIIIREEVPIPRNYFYTDVAWFSDQIIALVYYPNAQISFTPNILAAYNISTKEMMDLPMPAQSASCEYHWGPVSVTVSPTQKIAFTTACEPLPTDQLLIEYDPETGELIQLFDYHSMSATHFSFISADKVIQEDAVGYPMSNELWMISLTTRTESQMLTDFLRARRPTWSPYKKVIAFWGTEKFPGEEPGDLYTFDQISKLVRYPWDLYIMNESGERVQKILPLVANARGLQWSPTNNLLAFAGTVNDVEGIWLLDVDNPKPIRIFESSWLLTWSPDGKKIFVIQTKEPDKKNNGVSVKAYILELPNCVFENSCK